MTVIEEAVALGISQFEIAEACGVHQSLVCRWIGKCRGMTPERERLLITKIREHKENLDATD